MVKQKYNSLHSQLRLILFAQFDQINIVDPGNGWRQ